MSSNMNNINYDNFKNICRMCMFNCDVKFYQNCVVSSIFHKLTDLHFETNDDLPKQICQKCFEKTNEIHEFALHCKRTHSALMECLKKQQDVGQNENIAKSYELQMILDKNVTNNKQTTEFVENNSLNSTRNNLTQEKTNVRLNDDIIQGTIEIKEEILENTDLQETSSNLTEEITIEDHKIEFVKVEHVIDETREFNNDQSINYLADDFLITNTSNVESEETSNIKEEKKYECVQCSKSYHGRQHDGERPYKCNQCSKSPNQSNDLNQHMRPENSENSLKCEKCSKTFKSLSNLKIHFRMHSGERPFKCKHCLKGFIQSGDLKRHMRTHTGDRPFECDQCSKSFVQADDLKKHVRTHTGERDFKCKQCSNLFTRADHLKIHMRSHTGERPYKCKQCLKTFTRSDSLKIHMRTHTDERPFKCKLCSKSFNQSSHLYGHMRTHAHQWSKSLKESAYANASYTTNK